MSEKSSQSQHSSEHGDALFLGGLVFDNGLLQVGVPWRGESKVFSIPLELKNCPYLQPLIDHKAQMGRLASSVGRIVYSPVGGGFPVYMSGWVSSKDGHWYFITAANGFPKSGAAIGQVSFLSRWDGHATDELGEVFTVDFHRVQCDINFLIWKFRESDFQNLPAPLKLPTRSLLVDDHVAFVGYSLQPDPETIDGQWNALPFKMKQAFCKPDNKAAFYALQPDNKIASPGPVEEICSEEGLGFLVSVRATSYDGMAGAPVFRLSVDSKKIPELSGMVGFDWKLSNFNSNTAIDLHHPKINKVLSQFIEENEVPKQE